MIVNSIKIHYTCAGIGSNNMYWKPLNNGGWEGRGKRE
jgi:hypothetical protein